MFALSLTIGSDARPVTTTHKMMGKQLRNRMSAAVVVTALLMAAHFAACSAAPDARVGVMVPLHSSDGERLGAHFDQLAASAMLAVHHVNTRAFSLVTGVHELIPENFTLTASFRDSYGSPTIGVSGAIELVQGEKVDVLVASMRTVVSGPVSMVGAAVQTPTISYGSTASALSNKRTYPLLSRTAVSDDVLAAGLIEMVSAMGWSQIAVLLMDDIFGRGLAQVAARRARASGIDVAADASFTEGDPDSIRDAVAQVQASGAKVVLCSVLDLDLPNLVEFAYQAGLLEPGFVWINSGLTLATIQVLAAEHPKLRERLRGWLVVDFEERLTRDIDSALQSAPLSAFNHGFGDISRETFASGPCQWLCAMLYDAVLVAAIAAARANASEDGRPRKDQLLEQIRAVQFGGASGHVAFDEKGDRRPEGVPLAVKNLRPTEAGGGEMRLEAVVTWQWTEGEGLWRATETPPYWIGGRMTWDTTGEVECGDKLVYNPPTRRCEPCPRGTQKKGAECERVDGSIGVIFPLHNEDGVRYSDTYTRMAAAALMAINHINNRDTSLVRDAKTLLPPGFKLAFDIRDSFQTKGVIIDTVFDWMEEGRHAIIGAGRSSMTIPLCLTAQIFDVPVISFSSTAGALADRSAYPLLSRLVINDKTLALGTVQGMHALGWRRCSMLAVNDEFGRGLVQNMLTFATKAGMEIATVVEYTTEDEASIDAAVGRLKESGARVFVAVVHNSDFTLLLRAAARHQVAGRGFAWLHAGKLDEAIGLANVMDDAEELSEAMVGWIAFGVDVMHGEIGERFHEVITTEPLDALNYTAYFGNSFTAEAMTSGRCSQTCAILYDAVWAAAIALAKTGVATDGEVDKAKLLENIRTSTFYGATGTVDLDHTTGERTTEGITVLAKNIQFPNRSTSARRNDAPELAVVWRWQQESGMQPVSNHPPVWPGGERSWTAPLDGASCEPGWIFATQSLQCEACPPGTMHVGDRCQPCPLGTYAPLEAMRNCFECPEGYADSPGMARCKKCPTKTRRKPTSPGVAISECECVPGFYHKGNESWQCQECPPGAECIGGTEPPFPSFGYWGDAECARLGGNKTCPYWDMFLECHPENLCTGTKDFFCAEGRVGRMCSESDDGWFIIGQDFWAKCGPGSEVVTVFGICAVVLFWVGIEILVEHAYPAFGTALLFMQISAMISDMPLRWHRYIQQMAVVLSIVDFDCDFIAPSCIGPWSQTSSFFLQLFLPFLYAAVTLLLNTIRTFVLRESFDPTDKAWRCFRQFIVLTITTYHTLCMRCFSVFKCTTFPDGKSYMGALPQVECWTGVHIPMVVVSSLYIPGVLVGIPCFIFWVLRTHIKAGTLHSPEAVRMWDFLHFSYEADWKYWEIAMLLRRFVVALLSVMEPPLIQGALTITALTGALAAHVLCTPFINPTIDVLDFFSITGSVLFVLAGMLFYPSVTAEAQGKICVDGVGGCEAELRVREIVACVVLAMLIGTILVSFYLAFVVFIEMQVARKANRIIYNVFKAEEETMNPLQDLAETANMVSLEQLIVSARLTRVGHLMSRKQVLDRSVRMRSFTQQYMRVDQGIRAVSEDVSQYSISPSAKVIRHLCQLPGLLEILCWGGEEVRAGTRILLDALVRCMEAAESDAHPRPLTSSFEEEHQPLLVLWLLSCSSADRASFIQVTDSILMASGIAHDTIARRTMEGRDVTQLDTASTLISRPSSRDNTSSFFLSNRKQTSLVWSRKASDDSPETTPTALTSQRSGLAALAPLAWRSASTGSRAPPIIPFSSRAPRSASTAAATATSRAQSAIVPEGPEGCIRSPSAQVLPEWSVRRDRDEDSSHAWSRLVSNSDPALPSLRPSLVPAAGDATGREDVREDRASGFLSRMASRTGHVPRISASLRKALDKTPTGTDDSEGVGAVPADTNQLPVQRREQDDKKAETDDGVNGEDSDHRRRTWPLGDQTALWDWESSWRSNWV